MNKEEPIRLETYIFPVCPLCGDKLKNVKEIACSRVKVFPCPKCYEVKK